MHLYLFFLQSQCFSFVYSRICDLDGINPIYITYIVD